MEFLVFGCQKEPYITQILLKLWLIIIHSFNNKSDDRVAICDDFDSPHFEKQSFNLKTILLSKKDFVSLFLSSLPER